MRVLFSLMAMLVATPGLAATFERTIEGYPTTVATIEDCHSVARAIGQRLADSPEVASAVGVCTNLTATTYDIVLRYHAEEQLDFTSTLDAGITLTHSGFFASRSACEAVLSAESEAFTEATGLDPLFDPYCLHLGGFNNPAPWMFRIEAIGQPNKLPALKQAVVLGTPIDQSPQEILAETVTRLHDLGIYPRLTKYESTFELSHLVYFFYTQEQVHFEGAGFVKLANQATCRAELDYFRESLNGTTNLAAYCNSRFPTSTYELSALFLGAVPFTVIPTPETFADYAQCSRMRPEIIEASLANGLEVADGLCGLDQQGRWKVMLLIWQ